MHSSKEQMKTIDRLRRRSEFLSVSQKGKKWVSRSLILQASVSAHSQLRFGLTVTKKISGSAVHRNRIRRRLRAAAYDVMPFHAASGFDYVLIGRADTATRSYAELTADLTWCLKRLDCLKMPCDAP